MDKTEIRFSDPEALEILYYLILDPWNFEESVRWFESKPCRKCGHQFKYHDKDLVCKLCYSECGGSR